MKTSYIALGGTVLAAALATLAIAVWPASETDKARDDGERLGAAVTQFYEADDAFEADAARAEIDAAVADARMHAGGAFADQVDAADVQRAFWDGFESGVTA
jgi:hypothetical protein